jgi:hypothetical protein
MTIGITMAGVQSFLTPRVHHSRMLSLSSLSAFSSSVAQAALGGANPVQRVRSSESPATQPALVARSPATVPAGAEGAGPANRVLPRGSLLDLSV